MWYCHLKKKKQQNKKKTPKLRNCNLNFNAHYNPVPSHLRDENSNTLYLIPFVADVYQVSTFAFQLNLSNRKSPVVPLDCSCTAQLFNPFLLAIIVHNVHYSCINTLTLPFSSWSITLYTILYDSVTLGWHKLSRVMSKAFKQLSMFNSNKWGVQLSHTGSIPCGWHTEWQQ